MQANETSAGCPKTPEVQPPGAGEGVAIPAPQRRAVGYSMAHGGSVAGGAAAEFSGGVSRARSLGNSAASIA